MQKSDKRFILRMADKEVHRVFNNGSLEDGGRFYGAWWIGAPSIVRKYITINGNSTVELDYSGIHVHLLYARKGINYADLDQDAYKFDENTTKEERDLNKLILLTAFNANDEKNAAAAVWDELRKEGLLYQYNLKNQDAILPILKLLKEKHKPIADEIANKYGSKLQYLDSCVIEELIKYYTKKNIPILTIHDSVICEAQHAELVRDKMWQLYINTIDRMMNIKIIYIPQYSFSGKVLQILHKGKDICNRYRFSKLLQVITNTSPYPQYINDRPNMKNSIIVIKQEQRSNMCNKRCDHYKRVINKRKCYKSIKLELVNYVESYTNVLVESNRTQKSL